MEVYMEKLTEFNKEKVYKEKIEKLVDELRQICNQENMPMFLAICTSNNKKCTTYHKEAVTAATHEVKLKEDLIPKFINVTLGFETILPNEIPDIEIE